MQLPVVVRPQVPLRRSLRPATLWLLGGLPFLALAALAAAFDYFPADLWLAHRLQDIEAGGFVRALDWAEDIADVPWIVFVWLAGAAVLWRAACRWEALLLLAIMAGWPLNAGLKELVGRPRPSTELVDVSKDFGGQAFPSGHVTMAVLLYGFLFYLASVLIPQPLLRLLAQAACLYVILFTALERVYVGAHWPSDVLGGTLLAGLILAPCIWAHRRLRPSPPPLVSGYRQKGQHVFK